MKCPYCNKEMEKGLIQSAQEISWLKGEKKHLLLTSDLHEGSVVLSKKSFIKGSAVTAFLCRDCQKVVIDFSNEQSDYNAR